MLRLGYVGGFGAMSSPAARHLKADGPAQVVRVHDRGKKGPERDVKREAWRAHGAALVSSMRELVGGGDLDGIVLCAGKNGDDLPIIAELTEHFHLIEKKTQRPFLLHMSTVGTQFAAAASEFCNSRKLDYVNYPLTGGPKGAELGGGDPQGMLILCGGNPVLYEQVEPFLRVLGRPRFFGSDPRAGTRVKLINQLMVFNGCIGISSAAALYATVFTGGQLQGKQQTEFFEYINAGAGGTRQWDVSLSRGVRDGRWDQGFYIRHAVVDALYAADAAREAGLPRPAIDSMLNIALGFAFVLRGHPEEDSATHALAREFLGQRALQLDEFATEQRLGQLSIPDALERIQSTLPDEVRKSVALNVTERDFEQAVPRLH